MFSVTCTVSRAFYPLGRTAQSYNHIYKGTNTPNDTLGALHADVATCAPSTAAEEGEQMAAKQHQFP